MHSMHSKLQHQLKRILAVRRIFLIFLFLIVLASGNPTAATTQEQLISGSSPPVSSFGDISVPTEASKFSDSDLDIYSSVDDKTLTMLVVVKSYSGFGLFFSSPFQQVIIFPFEFELLQGDIIRVEILGNGQVAARDCFTTADLTIKVDDVENHKYLGHSTDYSSFFIVKFSRPLDTREYTQDIFLRKGQYFSFSYILNKNMQSSADIQNGSIRVLSGRLLNGQIFTAGPDTGSRENLYKIILTVVLFFVVDLAIWIKFVFSFKYRILMHSLLMAGATLITVTVLLVRIQNQKHQQIRLKPIEIVDLRLSITVVVWLLLQTLLGIFNNVSQKSAKSLPPVHFGLRLLHKYSGRFLLLVSKVLVMIIWLRNNNVAAAAVVLGSLLFNTMLYLWLNKRFISDKVSLQAQQKLNMEYRGHLESAAISQTPNTANNREPKGRLIFDNKIYEFQDFSFHPGGASIFDNIKARQIDRYIYGMTHLETSQNYIPAFTHPKSFLNLLPPPVEELPMNPLYKLPTVGYKVAERWSFSNSDNTLIYMAPNSLSVQFVSPKDMSHFGMYFAVEANSQVRLYSCVSCLRVTNRKLLQNIYKVEKIRILQTMQQKYAAQRSLYDTTHVLMLDASHDNSAEALPLLFKPNRSKKESFTNNFNNTEQTFKISGLRGKGLCLDKPGTFLIVVGGTGLFPFLDLIDLIFKITLNRVTNINYGNLVPGLEGLLKNTRFVFLGSFKNMADLIVPSQFHYLCERQNSPDSLIRMHLRFTQEEIPRGLLPSGVVRKDERFSQYFIAEKLGDHLAQLSQAFICGPDRLYRDVLQSLQSLKVEASKIVFL